MKKVLIVNLSGLGDIISSLYVANPLAEKYEEVSFLIPGSFCGLFEGTAFKEYLADRLPDGEFDLILDLTSDKASRKLVKKLKAKRTIGRYKNTINRIKYFNLYSHQVAKHPKSDQIVHDYLPVLDLLGIKPLENTYLQSDIAKQPSGEVCIHVGARNGLRRIPNNLIIDSCRYFEGQDIPVRLIGTEQDIAEKVREETGGYPTYELGSLEHTKIWLNNARLVIAPDSGIFHLSSALNTPTLGLYGPNTYERSGSINPNATHIELDFPCRPCNQNVACPYNVRCLNTITFTQLRSAIEKQIV